MTRSDLTFEHATPELVRAYYGGPPPFSLKGYVAVLDGRPIGIGGVFFSGGKPVAFSEMKDEMRPRLKDRARAVRVLEKLIVSYRVPVFAVVTEPTAPRLLERMGFKLNGQVATGGPVMERQPHA